jgi:nitroreductase
MASPTRDVWSAMSTARTIRRFTDEPVDEATLTRCLQAATWAPSGANAQAWRFVVLRSPELRAVVAEAAAHALQVIEPVYGMSRPPADDHGRRARTYRATYELHDRAGELTSVLFTQQRFTTASELLLGGSIFPAMQNFLLAARALGLGACLTSWASYAGEPLLRTAVGVPDDWMLAGHVVVGWPRAATGRSAAARSTRSCSSTAGTSRRPTSPATAPRTSDLVRGGFSGPAGKLSGPNQPVCRGRSPPLDCRICGSTVDPRRVELGYDYCTADGCQRRGLQPLRLARVAVNKAADQFVRADEVVPAGEVAQNRLDRAPHVPPSPAKAHPAPARRRARTTLERLQEAEAELDRRLDAAQLHRDRSEITPAELARERDGLIRAFNRRIMAEDMRYRGMLRRRRPA